MKAPRERQLIRLLESIAGRPLSKIERLDAQAFVHGGRGLDGVKLCECERFTAADCAAKGLCS